MMFKKLFLAAALGSLIFSVNASAQEEQAPESDQQIGDFSLSGYGDKGKKSWDIAGKSADIFGEVIKLKDIIGNMYGETEDIKLTAQQGDFNKAEGKVHLEKDVVVTTSSGAKLTTDTLDWDRKKQIVATKDRVNIQRGNMFTTAIGAEGKPDLNNVILEKDVLVDILPEQKEAGKPADPKDKITITCDGPLEVDYAKNIATFKNNVVVDKEGSQIYSDIMDVYFGSPDKAKSTSLPQSPEVGIMGSKIDKIIARGNVKIVQGENTSYSNEATYTAQDKKIMLTGQPRLVIYSTEEIGASFGN